MNRKMRELKHQMQQSRQMRRHKHLNTIMLELKAKAHTAQVLHEKKLLFDSNSKYTYKVLDRYMELADNCPNYFLQKPSTPIVAARHVEQFCKLCQEKQNRTKEE